MIQIKKLARAEILLVHCNRRDTVAGGLYWSIQTLLLLAAVL